MRLVCQAVAPDTGRFGSPGTREQGIDSEESSTSGLLDEDGIH